MVQDHFFVCMMGGFNGTSQFGVAWKIRGGMMNLEVQGQDICDTFPYFGLFITH